MQPLLTSKWQFSGNHVCSKSLGLFSCHCPAWKVSSSTYLAGTCLIFLKLSSKGFEIIFEIISEASTILEPDFYCRNCYTWCIFVFVYWCLSPLCVCWVLELVEIHTGSHGAFEESMVYGTCWTNKEILLYNSLYFHPGERNTIFFPLSYDKGCFHFHSFIKRAIRVADR